MKSSFHWMLNERVNAWYIFLASGRPLKAMNRILHLPCVTARASCFAQLSSDVPRGRRDISAVAVNHLAQKLLNGRPLRTAGFSEIRSPYPIETLIGPRINRRMKYLYRSPRPTYDDSSRFVVNSSFQSSKWNATFSFQRRKALAMRGIYTALLSVGL